MRAPLWLDWRFRTPYRGALLALTAVPVALALSHFPLLTPSWWLTVPAVASGVALADTTRCMQTRWSWYHGGVLMLVYMELMIATMVLFFLIYPFLTQR